MKIFYVPGSYPFCYYYRGYLPGVYTNQQVVQDFMRGLEVSAETYIEHAMKADVVCFQRPTSEPSLALLKLLKAKGKKIIFDNDDSYSGIPLARLGNEKRVAIAQRQNEILNEFVTLADGVTTSTQVLADEYGKLNQNVAVLKNTVDPLDEFQCKKNETGKFRIGIIGSVTSNDDYYHIKDQLRQLDERGDCTLVIMGIKFPDGQVMPGMEEDYQFWKSLKNVEWHTQCHTTEYMYKVSQLALDLVIIPRKEHYFNQCKSNLKFLEMSLLHIPVIAQGFSDGSSPYQGVDEPYMTVITNNDTWHEKIIEAKENYGQFKEKAEKAHEYVLEHYNINSYAQEWQQAIEQLCKSPVNI